MNVPQRNYYYICDRYHTLISTDTHFLCPNQLMRRHQRSHFLAYSCLARRHSRGHAFPVNTLSCNSVPDNRREFADSGDFPLPAYPVYAPLEQVAFIGSLNFRYFVHVFSLGPAMRISSLLLDTGSCSTSFES